MRKTSVIVVAVGLVFLIGILVTIEDRMRRIEQRLGEAEASLKVLEPLRRVFAGYRPSTGSATPAPYQATQATGSPNVTTEDRDSALAWCPATEDGGEEWLLLDFGAEAEATAVTIHAAWNPGAVVRILAIDGDDSARELWSGPAAGEAAGKVQEIRWPAPQPVRRLKLIIDTTAVPGWNEIDAVGLVGPDGQVRWAGEGTASSSWSRETRKEAEDAPARSQ